jgi:hypothetical protein
MLLTKLRKARLRSGQPETTTRTNPTRSYWLDLNPLAD